CLLLHVSQDQGLVMIFPTCLVGARVSHIVIPGNLPVRWGFDIADDRTPDPFADPLEERREIAGATAGPATIRDDLLAVDLDRVYLTALQGGRMIGPARDDDIALDPAERERDPQPKHALNGHLERVDLPLDVHTIAIDPVAGDHRIQQLEVAVD